MRPLTTAALLAALAFAAPVAHAATAPSGPPAGHYNGTAADGTDVNFDVGTDSNGVTAITAFGLGLSDTCHPGSFVYNTGWGLGADSPITNNKASYTSSFGYLYVTATIKFNGDTATGFITNATPTFQPTAAGAAPTKAAFCKAPRQSFSVSLQTTDAKPALRPGTAMLLPAR